MNQELWEKAVAFHGHACPGLAIGVKASEAAVLKLGIGQSEDEEIVCVLRMTPAASMGFRRFSAARWEKGIFCTEELESRPFRFLTGRQGKRYGCV